MDQVLCRLINDSLEYLHGSICVIVFSDRPASIKAQLTIERPYPRHRDDPYLVDLRKQILGLLGLGESW